MKYPFLKTLITSLMLMIFFNLAGCNAFMYGYTGDKALKAYYLVTGDSENFADKRLKYTKGFYKGSELAVFLEGDKRGIPAFIYEYEEQKRKGIQLFYPVLDSVFVFEQPRKNCTCSSLKAARKMDDYERLTYERLKKESK